MFNRRIKGKIAYCDNINLPGLRHLKGGHYVYIRNINKYGFCDVNTITSLEEKPYEYDKKKLFHVRRGNTYPIPRYDCNFPRWSGVTKVPIKNVHVRNLKDIGQKYIKRRHQFYIGKYCK